MRLIVAARELAREGSADLMTIALYTEPDRRAMFVREADESFYLGPAMFVDPRDGERKSRYLDYAGLERALVQTRAEAVWVGWGFVAEHAEFVDLCERLGVVFIGPSGDVMRRLGDKITAKRIAEEAKVPVAAWSGGPVESIEEAHKHGDALGYPLVVKATAGGGGRGIRRVHNAGELADKWQSARAEALKGFGDATVFMEKMVTGARHVEVQIMADSQGTTWAVGVRDCTIQRRNQKVMEESPSPVLSPEQDRELREAAARLGKAAGYCNAGTVEFLYSPETKGFSFMEVNARLQVEHPVTEMTTGLDLVKLQIHVAQGGLLEGAPPPHRGHAVELRLNAEDADNGFAPAPGEIERFRLPGGPGIRIDTGVEEGDRVPAEFDSMIAKIIAHGRTRDEALGRLQRVLASGGVVIRGGTSNKGFLLGLLDRPEVRKSEVDVAWLDGIVESGAHLSRRHAELAVLYAAIDAYLSETSLERSHFLAAAARGRPEVASAFNCVAELSYQGNAYELKVTRLSSERFRVAVDGQQLELNVEDLGRAGARVTFAGRHHRVLAVSEGLTHLVEVDGVSHTISKDSGGVVRAPSPAVVVSLAVKAGDQVAVGDRLAVVEAMKMEMAIVAKFPGRVREVMVTSNVQVAPGQPLMLIEAPAEEAVESTAERLDFAGLAARAATSERPSPALHNLAELRSLLLGYDGDPKLLRGGVMHPSELFGEERPDDQQVAEARRSLLTVFADLIALFARRVVEVDTDEGRRTAEECLFGYLRDVRTRGEGLPSEFSTTLERALAHHRIEDLEPTAELEEALFRLCHSYQRIDGLLGAVAALLQREIQDLDAAGSTPTPALRGVLASLLKHTQGQARFQAVNDFAREVNYRLFEQPVLERAREQVYAEAESHLSALAEGGSDEQRGAHIDALVSCPLPLKSFVSRRFGDAGPSLRSAIVEVLVRRYYRGLPLDELRVFQHQSFWVASLSLDFEGEPFQLLATHVPFGALEGVSQSLVSLVADVPPSRKVVIDFYAWQDNGLGRPDEVVEQVAAVLNRAGFDRPISRIGVTISRQTGGLGVGSVLQFTFRPGESGLSEDRVCRGIHPRQADRLRLWRFENFHLEPLKSVEDVYLFRGVAKDNAKDERLFALAEVRDLTEVTDEDGKLVALPHLERTFMEVLTGIRRFQSRRSPSRRLHWCRIHLRVIPPLLLDAEELETVVNRLAPATDNLGLERVLVSATMPDPETGKLGERVLDIANAGGKGLTVLLRDAPTKPLVPLSEYTQKVVRLRQRGLMYPYELIKLFTPAREGVQADFPQGKFVEHDLDDEGRLVPVDRPPGMNSANIVVGVITNFTDTHPEGVTRVMLASDPSADMGSLAEPECRRIVGALDLAEKMRVPIEWFAISAGAKISMESGVENMDWIALALRRLVHFTQDGGEVNVIVSGVNVGAQPYWNAEATMLMHTKGILIMTPTASMVLTGKRALDYSGGVSADDNEGIGGYDRIMGPNGQAQYFARHITEACHVLLHHYELTYVVPGERFPRRVGSQDPSDRDISPFSHSDSGGEFATVGDVFSQEKNPARKKPFDIRKVMQATVDQDHRPLERWFDMKDAENAVVWDARLGGQAVSLLGLESRPLPRYGFVPADGPEAWTAGTLFPLSSKKVARAINAASGRRPVVILANLSGFDGSPESMRNLQLEYGAEIGRAVVNFDGPIVFCVISRYHGGAFVVFSNRLNDNMEVAALEGAYASVIGGAPAAAVVFAREVDKRTQTDPRIRELEQELARADGAQKGSLRARLIELQKTVHSEKLGMVATEFDAIHSVQRARDVGAIHQIVPVTSLRQYLVEAVQRGMDKLGHKRSVEA